MATTAPVSAADRERPQPQPPAQHKPLGQRLLEAGLIDERQLDLALREQQRQGRLLGEVLVELGFVAPEIITDAVAGEAGTKVVDVAHAAIEHHVLDLIDPDTARRHLLIPLSLADGTLTIALADAFDVVVIDQVEKITGHRVHVVTAPESDIRTALARHYAAESSISDSIDRIMRDGVSPGDDAEGPQEAAPMVRLVDQIIAQGIKHKATDIHIEPDDKILRVRHRVDGVLHQEILIPKPIQAALIARLKLLGGLNITENRIPQDGRISFTAGQTEVDVRLSTLPTNHGESLVLRILNTAGARLSLDHLGFSEPDRERFATMMQRPYGMILVTGPTGSGKTTTLYSALSQVDAEARSVFTLEDPIEYSMGMVRQTQVRPDIGMDFAAGLRALLRQDPDVILVGEIRDTETAQLATRAALTGHLVLSTLHTNTAAGVIPRLIDMGVERYLLPSALAAVVGQRLVRRICDDCRAPAAEASATLEGLQLESLAAGHPTLWRGAGCDSCRHTGYRGRQAIYEIMLIDERFHDAIIDGAPVSTIEALAKEGGMRTMLEDGIDKALNGITTIEEIIRTVR